MRTLACAFLASLAAAAGAQTCTVCGQVREIREASAARGPASAPQPPAALGTGSGLDTPPVVGTVARFEFDRERPVENAWRLGSAGTAEMHQRLDQTYYEVTVLMDGGERRTVQRRDGNRFHIGQRVALRSGELEPM